MACIRCPPPWQDIDPDLEEHLAVLAERHPEQVARWPKIVLRFGPATLRMAREYAALAFAELDRLERGADQLAAGEVGPRRKEDVCRVSGAPLFHFLPGLTSTRDLHRLAQAQRDAIDAWLADMQRTN